jgi:hypothetical protein
MSGIPVSIFIEIVNGTVGTGQYEHFWNTTMPAVPAVGDVMVFGDGVRQHRVVKREWDCSDIFREVRLYLTDPRITERLTERHSMRG